MWAKHTQTHTMCICKILINGTSVSGGRVTPRDIGSHSVGSRKRVAMDSKRRRC